MNHESDSTDQEFVSEPITPERGAFSTTLMAQGLAALPAAFSWRGRRYEIIECLEHCKQTGPEGGVAGRERYLRRQVFRVLLDGGEQATLYFRRQPALGSSRRRARDRWFMYSISPAGA